jgi:hypothetical protein
MFDQSCSWDDVGLYAATAGTVYVGAKFVASNMRLQDGNFGPNQRRRVQ